MAKAHGSVSFETFNASVDAFETDNKVSKADAYEYVRGVYEGDDQDAKDAMIEAGRMHLKSLARGSNLPGKPGRKPSVNVPEIIETSLREIAPGMTPAEFAKLDKSSKVAQFVAARIQLEKAKAKANRTLSSLAA